MSTHNTYSFGSSEEHKEYAKRFLHDNLDVWMVQFFNPDPECYELDDQFDRGDFGMEDSYVDSNVVPDFDTIPF